MQKKYFFQMGEIPPPHCQQAENSPLFFNWSLPWFVLKDCRLRYWAMNFGIWTWHLRLKTQVLTLINWYLLLSQWQGPKEILQGNRTLSWYRDYWDPFFILWCVGFWEYIWHKLLYSNLVLSSNIGFFFSLLLNRKLAAPNLNSLLYLIIHLINSI